MKSYRLLVVAIVSFFLSTVAQADTQVSSITADPGTINPFKNETITFTVEATPGVTSLEIRVLSSDLSTLIRSGLTLTETEPGIYTTTWNRTKQFQCKGHCR